MRNIYVTIMQNTGSGIPGNVYATSSTNTAKLSGKSWSLDEGTQLTKLSAGDFTVEIDDPGDTIWTFITGQLSISGGLNPRVPPVGVREMNLND